MSIMSKRLFYEGNEKPEDEDVVANAHWSIRDVPREEYLTFKKGFLSNDDVGYVSKHGEYFQCNVCSKHRRNEQLMDAHANSCKQSFKYRELVRNFRAWAEALGFPSLSMYIAYKYAGTNEPYVSPPHCLYLRSNAPTPTDPDDETYINEEEDDLYKKPLAKKTPERKTKAWVLK